MTFVTKSHLKNIKQCSVLVIAFPGSVLKLGKPQRFEDGHYVLILRQREWLTLMTRCKEGLLLFQVIGALTEDGINRGLCWPARGVDGLKIVCFFHTRLETDLIIHAINMCLFKLGQG